MVDHHHAHEQVTATLLLVQLTSNARSSIPPTDSITAIEVTTTLDKFKTLLLATHSEENIWVWFGFDENISGLVAQLPCFWDRRHHPLLPSA